MYNIEKERPSLNKTRELLPAKEYIYSVYFVCIAYDPASRFKIKSQGKNTRIISRCRQFFHGV